MATTNWISDSMHSELGFKVRHLMITSVKGHFEKFAVQAVTEGHDFNTAQITVTADTASISTGVVDRDGHLKSDDFFSADTYPQIRFVSSSIEPRGDDNYILTGDLTIRGITKSIKLDVEYGGIVTDPYGQTKAGFTVEGKISRKEYGLTWSATTEAGGVVVADEIKLLCEVQLVKQG